MKKANSNYISIEFMDEYDCDAKDVPYFNKQMNHYWRLYFYESITKRRYMFKYKQFMQKEHGIRYIPKAYDIYKIVDEQKFTAFLLNYKEYLEIKRVTRVDV